MSDALTTRAEFEARRFVVVTLADGTRIKCRRIGLSDLYERNAVPAPMLKAAQAIVGNLLKPGQATPEVLVTMRETVVRVVVFAAIEPPISLDPPAEDSPALWAELLSLDELSDIFAQVTGYRPTGAAATEAFRGGAAPDAGAPTPDGESVQPASEPVPAGGSIALVHG